jgi:TrmH family RNA methyltransferase
LPDPASAREEDRFGTYPMKHVHSRQNPLFRMLVKLATSSRERRERGAAILDGPHLVAMHAASGRSAEALFASESGLVREEVRRLLEEAPAGARAILSDRLFQEIAQVATPVGIGAWVSVPDPGPVPERPGECVLLDAIQDAGNVGSILRTAAAAGLREAYLGPGTAFAWAPKVLRAAQGAHFALAIHESVPLVEIASRFAGQVWVTAGDADLTLYDADLCGPNAWIFGNEGAGVAPELGTPTSRRVAIPMAGGTESLNVAAAAAICLFEAVRQRRASGPGR